MDIFWNIATDTCKMDASIRQTTVVGPCMLLWQSFYCSYILYKLDTSLRQTAWAGPDHVYLRKRLEWYTQTDKIYFCWMFLLKTQLTIWVSDADCESCLDEWQVLMSIPVYSQLSLLRTPSGRRFVSGIARVHNTGSHFQSNLYRCGSKFCP